MRTETKITDSFKSFRYYNDSNVLSKIELFNLNDELEALTTFFSDGMSIKTVTLYREGVKHFAEYNEQGEVILRKTEKLTK